MPTKKITHHVTKGKNNIELFSLSNERQTEVIISNYGAKIISFQLKNEDNSYNDIVLGFDTIEEYKKKDYIEHYPWFGSAIGRYANRIKNAQFRIDNQTYLLSKNNGNNQLHGGLEGFDKKIWTVLAFGDSPNPFLEMKYVSADGEEGFPGNLDSTIRFELNNNDEVSYEYRATTDKTTAINLTHHSYFNLNNGIGTIKDHAIKIHSTKVIDQDSELIATGTISDTADSVFDFCDFTLLSDRLNQIDEFDKSYVVTKEENGTGVQLVAEAKSSKSNLLLQVFSTEPIVHFYTGKWIPALKGKNGGNYNSFSGLCLETHSYPNAVNIPEFPSTVLKPGELYYSKTKYIISRM